VARLFGARSNAGLSLATLEAAGQFGDKVGQH
jgi:hypothetical protein